VIGEVRAGEQFTERWGRAAWKLYRRAAAAGADAVVMVEYTSAGCHMQTKRLAEPAFINPKDASARRSVLWAGKRMDYSDVAMLAAFGHCA